MKLVSVLGPPDTLPHNIFATWKNQEVILRCICFFQYFDRGPGPAVYELIKVIVADVLITDGLNHVKHNTIHQVWAARGWSENSLLSQDLISLQVMNC